MASLPLTRQQSIPRAAARRGRPFSRETVAQEIEGHAMGVVSETTFGADDLSQAVALERIEGGILKQVRLQIEEAAGLIARGNPGKALGLLRASLVHLDRIGEFDLDAINLLAEETPEHIGEARDEGREIIGLASTIAPTVR